MNAIEAYLLARAYTNKAIEGSGALKGAPCQIKSITSITGGHRVTFEWEDSEGETSTNTMDVMDGTNGTNGTDGDDGVGISSITYKEEDQYGNYVYTVLLTDSRSYEITCPKGPQGQTGQTGQTGATGNGIVSIEKTSTSGLVDTYTITYTNGDTDTFTVTNGTTYTAGDYIDITSGEISVDREIPSVIAEYEIKTEPMVSGQAFISVTKTVNGEVVLTQKYGSNTAGISQGINFDDNIYVDYSKTAAWSWTYKLRNASVDHAANYTQSWNYGSTVDYTEEFIVTDHSGDKLVIKSEMDTELADKADTDMVAADFDATASYTTGNYCVQDGKLYKFKNNHSGAWSSADVDEVKITGELSALKSGLTEVNSKLNGLHFAQITRTTDQYGQLPVDNGILSKMVGAFVLYDPNVDGNMFAVYANTGTLRIYAMNNASHTADTAHFVQEKTVVVNILYYDFS